MPAAAHSQRAALHGNNTPHFYFRHSKPKFHAAAFCPHGSDMDFRLPVGIVSKACAKGGFV
ncbi:hypothetical protein [Mesorhizobium ventifaucium]|uniref:Uncharacterized protein n=1 Tax=Mesorhizobium ventifaucium TaxID=666020 RepID=A0ABM9DSQ6_9HYPH|nr:hypothetical protein [Mesorhizobium ventifaucium]CAH2399754.1 hypothetical protein MES4922_220042 [Mesorhizobium ventifaucium]